MTVIWKFPMYVTGHFVGAPPPQGSKCIYVGDQDGLITAWFEVPDTSAPLMEDVPVVILGTGHPFEREGLGRHISTFHQGPFVWHAYEVLP